MDRVIKIFDVVSLTVLVVLFLELLASIFSPATLDRDFIMGCMYLFTGTLVGVRGFFKTRPFYVPRKTEWSLRNYCKTLPPALTFAALGIYTLLKPPRLLMATMYILSAICIILFINKLKQQ